MDKFETKLTKPIKDKSDKDITELEIVREFSTDAALRIGDAFNVTGSGMKIDRTAALKYVEYMTRIPFANLKRMTPANMVSITNEVVNLISEQEEDLGEE